MPDRQDEHGTAYAIDDAVVTSASLKPTIRLVEILKKLQPLLRGLELTDGYELREHEGTRCLLSLLQEGAAPE